MTPQGHRMPILFSVVDWVDVSITNLEPKERKLLEGTSSSIVLGNEEFV